MAGECDLDLPSGVVWLTTLGGKQLSHNFGGLVRVRVRAVVAGRGTRFEPPTRPERHRLWLWPSSSPQPRWRSVAIDDIGAALAQVTEHVA